MRHLLGDEHIVLCRRMESPLPKLLKEEICWHSLLIMHSVKVLGNFEVHFWGILGHITFIPTFFLNLPNDFAKLDLFGWESL